MGKAINRWIGEQPDRELKVGIERSNYSTECAIGARKLLEVHRPFCRMVESKSAWNSSNFNGHSDEIAKFDPKYVNRLPR